MWNGLHSKAFGGPQQTPANVPLSEHHLASRASTITHSACAVAVTHTLHPANQSLGLLVSTGTRRPATLLLSLAALQQFRQHTGELLTLVNALGSPSSLQLLRFLVFPPFPPSCFAQLDACSRWLQNFMAPLPSSPHSHHTLLLIQGFTRNAQWVLGGEGRRT